MRNKTNKSFSKRLKVTKGGKILSRKPGQCHFNAKESGRSQIGKKKMQTLQFSSRDTNRFLTNI